MPYSRFIMISLLIFALCISNAYSTCVKHTFDKDFDTLFSHGNSTKQWKLGYYKDTDIVGHHEKSESFMYAEDNWSCVKSFEFPMSFGGILEVTSYTESWFDKLVYQVYKIEDHKEKLVGQVTTIGPGWKTTRLRVIGLGDFSGFVRFFAWKTNTRHVIVDAFRYIPLESDESLCRLYENDVTESTTTEMAYSTTTELPTTFFIFFDKL